MNLRETIGWQWKGYAKYHQNKGNLLVHVFAVPLIWFSVVMFVYGILKFSLVAVFLGFIAIFVSLILQNIGHKREQNPAVPFENKTDFLKRLLCEQFVTFPRFILTGGWSRNFKNK